MREREKAQQKKKKFVGEKDKNWQLFAKKIITY